MNLLLQVIVLSVQCTFVCFYVTGALLCTCSTKECKRENKTSCTASHNCYVQLFKADDSDEDVIDRGCINNPKSLLCENRRPQHFKGPWPLLYCCKDDWCNTDALPSVPPWEKENQDASSRSTPSSNRHQSSILDATTHQDGSQNKNTDNSENSDTLFTGNSLKTNISSINPIYIAVPIAGTCILLAIIIFAIFMLKKHNQSHDYRYHDKIKHKTNVPSAQVRTRNMDYEHAGEGSRNSECSTGDQSERSETRLLV